MPTISEIYDQGEVLRGNGKLEEAVAKYQECLEQDVDYELAHAAMSVVKQKLGRHDEAVAHGQKVCDLSPNDPFSFSAFSIVLQRIYADTNDTKYVQLAEDAMEKARLAGQ